MTILPLQYTMPGKSVFIFKQTVFLLESLTLERFHITIMAPQIIGNSIVYLTLQQSNIDTNIENIKQSSTLLAMAWCRQATSH